ncbi:cell wall protein DAN4-like isoform X2 [Pomacea canaliculata]|uniref:cell wall protein DAN4-like isoform X2 n=1 Tax=Pomacea canaliculata TaxID=400727 RepID=UPI000D73E2A4|nr:cell wall protein DAN4-like isoform X2 [Pomacea canaliculata]
MATNKLNLWRFSSCSINYFNTFISNKLTTPRGQQCLYNNLTSSNIPDVSGQQPGQVYDHDAQCRQTYGPSSVMCRGIEFYNKSADICTTMFCNDGTTGNRCAAAIAARGTSCGNKKWCVNGQCVYDIQAPSLDDNCPFGDQPGLVFNNQTCAQMVSSYSGYCYQDVVLSRCCRSCANYYIGLQNCTYGDKATGCSKIYCSTADTDYLSSCCGTCKYGTPITTSSTTSPDVTSSSSFSTTTTTSTVMTTVVSTTTLPTTPTTSTSTLLPTTTTATTIPSTSSTSASKTTTTATQNPAGAATTTALPTSPTTLTSTLLTTTTTATIPSTSASKTTKTVTQNPAGAATTTTLPTSTTTLTSTLLATTTTTILSTSSTSALKSSTTVTQNPAGAATTTTTQTADTCLDEKTYSSVCSTLPQTPSGATTTPFGNIVAPPATVCRKARRRVARAAIN